MASLRQSGTHQQGGVLRKGTTGVRVGPSIPSKYETILHAGARESDGFLSRTHRFQAIENELPGPGAYHRPRRFEPESDSYSKKGYGNGFVSKSKRFTGTRTRAPGPGQYETNRSELQVVDPFHKAPSRVFMKPIVTASTSKSPAVDEPGPGQYELQLPRSKPMGKTPFMSSETRFREKKSATAPAPGQYNPTVEVAKPTPAASASFKSKTKRETSLMLKTGATEVVGPGSYSIDRGISTQLVPQTRDPPGLKSHKRIVKASTIHHPPAALDKTPQPGPGDYDAQLPKGRPAGKKSSFFASTTHRQDMTGGKKHPGPALYKPHVPGHKSFHLNAEGRWL